MKWANKGNEFARYRHALDGRTNIYLYGAGILGLEVAEILERCAAWLPWNASFVDNDPEKLAAGRVASLPVIAHAALARVDRRKSFVVVCGRESNMVWMIEALDVMGFEFGKNVFTHDFFALKLLPLYFFRHHNMVYFSSLSTLPTTRCNLNCRGCLNFNPYLRTHATYDIAAMRDSLDALFGVVDLIFRFQITGGEPFLYPGLGDLANLIGENYAERIVKFEVVTNGTVLPTDEMCATFKNNKVRVILDDYRNSLEGHDGRYREILERLLDRGVSVQENRVDAWFDLAPETTDHSACRPEQLETRFDRCGCPYASLENKRISSCNYAWYACKAGLVEYIPGEYFDLTGVTDESRAELVEFRMGFSEKGYVEFCKRCAGYRRINHGVIDVAVQMPRKRNEHGGEEGKPPR
ncbi:MAG: radical SAM protein [Planctomycetota bacterium]|jgi:hypothetical protein|nr:radical SAM protein [Planctomycetota bacterium]